SVSGGGRTLLSAPTGADGRVLVFPGRDGAGGAALTARVDPPPGVSGKAAERALPAAPGALDVVLGVTAAPPAALHLASIVHTTGSMGDELNYLKAEIGGIAAGVQRDFGGVSLRYGLVVYRDHGDEYVSRAFNFTASLAQFQDDLGHQSFGGGGDTP